MPHVSKKELESDVKKEIEAQLLRAFSPVRKKEVQTIVQELLTDTERLMLAKRLAVIRMLEQEYSYYRIEQSLGISVSTSKRLHQQLISGSFPTIERQALKNREQQALLKTIDTILRGGLPPRAYVYHKQRTLRSTHT